MTDMEALLAEREIIGLAVRYTRSLDERDWDGFRSCFTGQVEVDASGLRGVPAASLDVDAWVARVRSSVEAFDVTLHYITNHQVTIEGDEASCYSYLYAQHFTRRDSGDERFVVHGAYTHGMRRTSDGWRICGVKAEFKIRDGVMPPPRQIDPPACRHPARG